MSLLWSLHSPSGKPSWLFGTMHIRDDRVYQICHALYPLLLRSDGYIGEMNLEPVDVDMTIPLYEIRDHFKPGQYQKMRSQILKSFGFDLDRYAHLHPLMVLSVISHSVLQADHAVSLDEHLWSYAKEHHLELAGLESAEEQMKLLYSIEPGPLYRQIRNISATPENVRRFTGKVLALYLKEDVHTLYRMTKSSLFGLRKKIIYRRNTLMVQRITALDPERSFFVTVGAGHLSGQFGIISLLRKSGWAVRPMILGSDTS